MCNNNLMVIKVYTQRKQLKKDNKKRPKKQHHVYDTRETTPTRFLR